MSTGLVRGVVEGADDDTEAKMSGVQLSCGLEIGGLKSTESLKVTLLGLTRGKP